MKNKIAALACGLALAASLAAPAAAGFYFEGLSPYVGDYCRDADPALTDPQVVARNFDWDQTSPDASTLGGRRAYEAAGCLPGKAGAKAPGRFIKTRPAPQAPYRVPQK
ncbi:hypothetical protein [Paracoccus sp. ME4]|uniref:hypothetical protein n=1 Tax=Paracoccus sp. ME4 TaxID=3138066 RepID=UPI00398A8DC8